MRALRLIAPAVLAVAGLGLAFFVHGPSRAVALLMWIVWPLAMLWTAWHFGAARGYNIDHARGRRRLGRFLSVTGWLLLLGMLYVMLTSETLAVEMA